MANVLVLTLVNVTMDGVDCCVMILTVALATEVAIALLMATVVDQEFVLATLAIAETTVNTQVKQREAVASLNFDSYTVAHLFVQS